MNILRTTLFAITSVVTISASAIKAVDMRCEYMTNPVAVQTAGMPRLSWVVDADGARGAGQSAYRILAATTPELLTPGKADLWDSGKQESNATLGIEYAGKALKSFDKAYWSVLLWDVDGKAGDWSDAAQWSMGVLTTADWGKAQWIGRRDQKEWRRKWDERKAIEAKTANPNAFPLRNYGYIPIWEVMDSVAPAYDGAPLLRREFKTGKGLKSATLYICGLGYFEASINGSPVSDDVLNPAWSNYDVMPLYSTYDVTELINKGGDNAIGVMLGRGQYNPIANDGWKLNQSGWVDQPKLIARLNLTYDDGHTETVVTDNKWRVAQGPIVFDDTRIGEIYNARLEQPGWDKPGFDDSQWNKPHIQQGPTSGLQSQMMPPVRRHSPYPVKRTFAKGPNRTVYDFGQNVAGWTRLRVKGPRGARVWVEYTECPTDSTIVGNLHPGRFIMTGRVTDPELASFHDATSEVRQQNGYILAGKPDGEDFECHFSYKGFQYARVTTDPGVEITYIESVPVYSDLRQTGRFECGNPMINRLQEISRITLLNNLVGIPTDCPHREKQGWTADAYMTAEAALYNFDMAQFYNKWCHDLLNTQSDDGVGCTVAPSWNYDKNSSIVWPAAIVYVPENIYDHYGDRRLIEQMYHAQKMYTENIRTHESKSKRGYINEVLGDWVSPLDTILPTLKGSSLMAPPEGTRYYGSATYNDVLGHMTRIAGIMGNNNDIKYYTDWRTKVNADVNGAFYRPDEHAYYGEQPTAYRMAPNVVALDNGLVPDSLRGRVATRLIDFIAGQDYKMKTGFLGTRAMMRVMPELAPEVAYRMVTQPEYPGWMYMIKQGTTTVWEDWNASASLNHLPYTLVSQYFFKNLGGIQLSHKADGTPDIVLKPYINEDTGWANTEYESVYGTIASRWTVNGGLCNWTVTVPANRTATIVLPVSDPTTVTESGISLDKTKGICLNSDGTLTVTSGTYTFSFPMQ